MINYKKNLLSIATCLALATSATASSYLPLTSETKDNRWVLFGVNGFKSVDTGSGVVSAAFETTALGGWTQLTDSTIDNIAVSGLNVDGTANEDLATLRATVKSITIAVDLSGKSFSATEPVRTMYIDSEAVGVADVILKYKASLEGSTVDFTVGSSSTVYQTTINAANTFSNPATRIEKSDTASTEETNQLTTITDTLDRDLLNNPSDPANYVLADDPAVALVPDLRMYSYDSTNSKWNIYDSSNSNTVNDFTSLKEGSAYWAKLDADADGNSNRVTKAGFVLGSSGLADSDYEDQLVAGWNLISFDATNPDIRTSSTGLILTIATGVATDIEIYDATGNNEVIVTLGASTILDARLINSAIEGSKARGDIPDSFDLKAFYVSATQIALISNKQFSIKDAAGDADITGVTTLTGSQALDLTTNALGASAAVDTDGFSSVYGEFMLMINPLISESADLENAVGGAGTQVSASIQVNTDTYNLRTSANAVSALSETASNLTFTSSDTSKEYKAIEIDIDYDGTTDRLLLSAQEKFYIKDHTFTRVYDFDTTNIADANTLQLVGAATNTAITPDTNLATTVTAFNAVADIATDATSVFAAAVGSQLILVSASSDATIFNIYDHATSEYVKDSSLDADSTKGAIKEVYAVNTLAKQAIVKHQIEIDITATQAIAVDNIADTLTVDINNASIDTDISFATVVGTSTTARLAMFDALVAGIKAEIITAGIDATVIHDYAVGTDDVDTAIITVSGHGITQVDIAFTDSAGVNSAAYTTSDVNTATAGMLSGTTGTIVSDLKYNAVYSPDFVSAGPLYTLKGLGYTAQAIITGSTQMSDGVISWRNIDLTEASKNWFNDQDYNLFGIDGKAGYWAYLIENANDSENPTNELAISASTLTTSYTTHFNSDTGGTTDLESVNIASANISLTLSGLPDDITTTRVVANVGGSDIELVESAGTYTATITSYEVNGLAGNEDVTISISDGIGWTLASTSIGSMDLDKPLVPSVTQNRGDDVVIASASTDVVNYNIYENFINEATASTSTFSTIAAADAGSYNLCGASSALAFGTETTFRVIALDGGGAITTGNASDALEFKYTPTIKGAQLLTHQEGVDIGSKDLAEGFDSSCVSTGTGTADSGISLESLVTDSEIKMSYIAIDNANFSGGSNIPNTFYIGIGSGSVAEIQFTSEYATKAFFIEIGGVLYSSNFPAAGDTTNNASDDPVVLATGDKVLNQNL